MFWILPQEGEAALQQDEFCVKMNMNTETTFFKSGFRKGNLLHSKIYYPVTEQSILVAVNVTSNMSVYC